MRSGKNCFQKPVHHPLQASDIVEAIVFGMLTRFPMLFALAVANAHAQQAVTVGSFLLPAGEGVYFGAGPFRNQPPTFTLSPKSPGARNGTLWIRNASQGLLIAGKIDGPAPEWATERAALLAKDHI